MATIYVVACGLGMPILIVGLPRKFRTNLLPWALAPLIGIGLLSVVSSYTLMLNRPIDHVLVQSVAVTIFVLALAAIAAPGYVTGQLAELVQGAVKAVRAHVGLGLLALALLFLVAAPGISNGSFTTPYRVGIDQVGYAETAQFLRTGGTLHRAEADIRRQTGEPSIGVAKASNLKSLRFNSYVDSEFLLKAFRWGYPANIAIFTKLLAKDHPYMVEYELLVLAVGMLLVVMYYALRDLLGLSATAAMVTGSLLVLNANGLNTLLEGQYAQAFTAPAVLFLLWLGQALRVKLNARQRITRLEQARFLCTASFLFAALMVSFNEAASVILALSFLTAGLALLTRRRLEWRWLLRVVGAVVVGLAIVFPYAIRWMGSLAANLANAKNGGFPQPKWAFPSEILGIQNIYGSYRGYSLIPRDHSDLFVTLMLSSVVLSLLFSSSLRNRRFDPAFWLAPAAFIAITFVKNYYLDDHLINGNYYMNNYQYMKAYTLVLPLVCGAFFGTMLTLQRGPSLPSSILHRLLAGGLILATVFNGLSYLNTYRFEGGRVTSDLFAVQSAGRRLHLERYALVTGSTKIANYMLAPLIQMNWLDTAIQTGGFRVSRINREMPVLLLLQQGALGCLAGIDPRRAGRTLYQNEAIQLLATGKVVREIYDEVENSVRWSVLLGQDGDVCARSSTGPA